MKTGIKIGLAALALVAIASTQVSLFVIQPIGALPEGRTILVFRGEKMKFIDSADAICQREMGGVSLFCRMGVLSGLSKNTILLRMPYSEKLYLYSTNGNEYNN